MARIPSLDFNNLVNELELIEGDISGQRQFLVKATAHVGPVVWKKDKYLYAELGKRDICCDNLTLLYSITRKLLPVAYITALWCQNSISTRLFNVS